MTAQQERTQRERTADQSFGELVGQLSAQTSRLVRDELRLAQKEFQHSASKAGKGAGLLSAATVLAFLGAATAVAAIVAGLSVVLPVWASAAIVAAALLASAGIAASISKKEIEQVTPAAPQTVESVKHDIHDVKEAAHGAPH